MAGFWTAVYLYLTRPTGESNRVVIQGAGNSGNTVYVDTVIEELASQLAQQEDFAQITPGELSQIGGAIRERAFEGDPTAALVMMRIEQLQRGDTQ